MEQILSGISTLFPQFTAYFYAGVVVFARLAGFVRFAPVFHRSDVIPLVKIGFVFLFTLMLTPLLNPPKVPDGTSLALLVILNITCGAIIGYTARLLILAIESAGDMINTQMGLSSAMVMDPSTNSQTALLSNCLTLLGTIIFIHIGGLYWMFKALIRSFEIFPLYASSLPLNEIINMGHLITMTSNVLYIGLQIAAPILLATLGQDIILGIISRTAPQVNVFQLSFLFKPVFGAAIMIWILPMLINVISDFFTSNAAIF